MDQYNRKSCNVDALVAKFFEQDDLKQLATNTGELLDCPLLVLDDTFHVVASFSPIGFFDQLFHETVAHGEITYEAGAIISKSAALSSDAADYVKLDESAFRRRFAPLISTGVRLGYLICVDTDGHLQKIPAEVWQKVEMILAKQLFIETSRQDKPFETTEDILMHLLDGGFPSAPYFRLQAANTYLADFHPYAFALIDLTTYHSAYIGKRHLKGEIDAQFPDSHPFLYRGSVFLFLQSPNDIGAFSSLAKEFQLHVIISEPISDLFALPTLYRTTHEALELMTDERFHSGRVCSADRLRTPLLLKRLEGNSDLIAPKLRVLAEHDRIKDTQYCETLYYYLICSRSLMKTCDALFTHRNTVLYRIRRMQEVFMIPLDDPAEHTGLLLGAAMLMFKSKGPDFFLHTLPESPSCAFH